MHQIFLKPGREKSLLRRHPWVFSGAIARVEGKPGPGETVDIRGADGTWLARAAWSPDSQMRARVWTFDRGMEIDEDFFRGRIAAAAENRTGEWALPGGACRMVHGESDGIPGLIIDRYGGWYVAQFLSAGTERWRGAIIAAVGARADCAGVYERSDSDSRVKEGLEKRCGTVGGGDPPEYVEITEGGCRFLVDIRTGHKTGFYLDQRVNRSRVAALSPGHTLLNCFSYTGGFGTAALAAGASQVTDLDSSAPALELARRHAALNGVDPSRLETVCGDAFAVLRQWRAAGRRFDIVVLDPPKFVDSRAKLEGGCRGYKDINMQACALVAPGGLLVTFSCSGLVTPELFQKVVADAALDAGREARMIERLSQSPDHPVLLAFPEGLYLKGLVCRIQ